MLNRDLNGSDRRRRGITPKDYGVTLVAPDLRRRNLKEFHSCSSGVTCMNYAEFVAAQLELRRKSKLRRVSNYAENCAAYQNCAVSCAGIKSCAASCAATMFGASDPRYFELTLTRTMLTYARLLPIIVPSRKLA